MAGFGIEDSNPGAVYDIASSLDDLVVLYRKKGTVEPSFQDPGKVEEELAAKEEAEKKAKEAGRNVQDVKKSESRDVRDAITEVEREFAAIGSAQKGKWKDDEIHSETFLLLEKTLDNMFHSKEAQSGGRNTWQFRQTGGQGDPFYRDSLGFEEGIRMTIDHGRKVFAEKWGHRDCDIRAIGLKPEDAWKMEHDWD